MEIPTEEAASNQPTNPQDDVVLDLTDNNPEVIPETADHVPEPKEAPSIPEVGDKQEEGIKTKYKEYEIKYRYSYESPKWKKDDITVNFPSLPPEITARVFDKIPNVDLSDSKESDEWVGVLREGIENTPYNNLFNDTVNDPEANFTQEIDYNGVKCSIAEVKTNFNSQNLQGERAILAFNKHMGIGSLVNIPLWHTGIWVILKTPTEAEILQLQREIVSDKIQLGRSTYGLAFSNMVSFTVERVTRFVLDHIYDTTLKPDALGDKDLREIIKVHDLNILIWGIICAMYPKGFQYQRACLSDPEKCNYILKEQINLTKLLWVNYSALTDKHIHHMSIKQPKTKSLESVLEYQNSLPKLSNKVIATEDGNLKITLESPSLLQYIESGNKWVSNIVEVVDNFSTDAGRKEKDEYILEQAQASSIRQIGYWVKNLEFGDNIIEDPVTLEKILDIMSQDDDKREFVISEVVKYMQESVFALIGIPSYNCPNCGETQKHDYKETSSFANLIPLDVIQLFFDQHSQRIQKILTR